MTHLPVLLNPDLTEVKRLSPVSLNLKLNMTPLSTASMTLSEGEEIPSRSFVEIFTAKGSAGVFRAREPETRYGETQTSIELEHAITEVGDSLVTTSIEEEMPLDEAMATLFEYYKGDSWQMDEIDFTDTVVVDVDYANVLEALISVLQQVPSYYMTFDFSTTPWTFGLAQVDSNVSAEGRLSRNVSSGSFKNDDSSLTTRAYALYKDGDNEILIHEDSDWGIQHFGLVERKLSDTYESEAKARAAAQKYLEQNNRPRFSISINGTELSDRTGETYDEFEIGKRFRFVFDPVIEPVDEIIKSVEYTDLVTDEHNVIVSMNEEEELDYVLDGTKQNAKNNRATSKNLKNLNDEIHKELYDEDGYFNSRLDFTASHLRLEFTDNLNSMRGELEMTASHLRTVFDDGINSLHGEFEVSASHLRTVFEDGQNSLRSEFEITASHMRTEFSNSINSMRTIVEQTDSGWRTALSGVVDSNGRVTAASIATKINSQGAAGVAISGDWVKIDAGSTLTLSDIMTIDTADNDSIVRLKTAKLRVGTNVSNLISFTGGVITASGFEYKDTSDNQVKPIIVKADIVSANTLRLTKSDGTYVDFSKAVTLSGAWSSGNFPLTINATQTNGGTTTNVGSYKVGFGTGNDIGLYLGTNGTPTLHSGSNTLIDAPLAVYTVSYVSSQDPNHKTNRYTETVPIDASAAYNKGVMVGKSNVTLNDPTWNAISGAMPSSRTVTVTTSGRTNSSGTTDNLSKSVSLYLVKSGLTVYMRTGSTSGTTYAQTTCSDSNLSAGNIKSGVTIFGVTGNYSVSQSISDWNLVYYASPSTYHLKAKVGGGSWQESGNFYASEAYDNGYKAGWAAYYDDSHWDDDYYNSSTGKYEAWTPARTVSKNSSGQWVSNWASQAWFSYNNFTGTPEAHSHSEGFYVTITQNSDGSKTMNLAHTYPAASTGSIPFTHGSTKTLYW